MGLFRKKCAYCGEIIQKGEEILVGVKLPEFTGLRSQPFCCSEHAEMYKKYVRGTPSRSSCPHCKG